MSARARPRLVGAFVLVAAALTFVGLVLLSSGQLFSAHRTFVVFFPNAVGGLKPGAQVTLRQVPVGEVSDVQLVFPGTSYTDSRIMVVLHVRQGAIRDISGPASIAQLSDADLAQAFVAAGLRAVARSSSPVAGQKTVDLDFQPNLPARFAGIPTPYPEIPTAPTGMELLNDKLEDTLKRLADVPLDEVLLQIRTTLTSAQKVLDSRDLSASLKNLRVTLETANHALASSEKTMASVDGVALDARATMASVNETLKKLGASIEQTNRTLATLDRNVERTAEVQFETSVTLDEMRELLKSLRLLIESVQRHPESLLRGKPNPKEKN